MIIKNVKIVELNTKNATTFFNTQTLKIMYWNTWNTYVYLVTRTIKKSLMKI